MNGLTLDTAVVAGKRRSVRTIMLHVIVALLPGIVLYALLIDSRIVVNISLAASCALLFESVLVMLRRRAALPVITDASAALAAILLVLSIPQSLPLWQLVFGTFILCSLGKHVFGGLGHNPFNPAMVAYAVMIVSFPLTMTQWTEHHGFLDRAVPSMSQMGGLNDRHEPGDDWDNVTMATPLDRLDTYQRESKQRVESTRETHADDTTTVEPAKLILHSDWIWISIAWLMGGLYLLFMRVISWHIPTSVLLTLLSLYFFYNFLTTAPVLPASLALFSGAIMLGAFFIATDPVSAATSNPGKLVYGVGIGVLCFFIREFSAYPEGMAFAVLLMNMCVPLIDHAFTRNTVKGVLAKDKFSDDSRS